MKLRQLAAIISKDVRLFLNNRASVILTLVVPIAIASFFGYVFAPKSPSGGSGRMKLWVADLDGSAVSKEIVSRLTEDKSLRVSAHTEAETRQGIAAGEAPVAIVLPAGFGEKAGSSFFTPGEKPSVTLLVDPSRTMESGLAQGVLIQHAMAVIGRDVFSPGTGSKWIDQSMKTLEYVPGERGAATRELLASVKQWMQRESQAGASGGGGAPSGPAPAFSAPFETKVEPLTGNKNAVYNGYAHSFGGMSLQFILMFGIECAVLLLQDRKSGMWKRLRAAPVSRATVLTGRALSCALIAFVTMTICWGFAMIVCGVRVHGSWAGFILINAASALLAASFALMLAGIGRSVEATRGIAIFAVLILVMLGGAWVPSFIFPEWLQNITQFIPTRWAVDGMDGMTWRGLPFSTVVVPLLSLTGCIALFGVIAWWRFRWQGE
jgi:ABC-2 type transport system permease protein